MEELPSGAVCHRCQQPLEDRLYWDARDAEGNHLRYTCDSCYYIERLEDFTSTGIMRGSLIEPVSLREYFANRIQEEGIATLDRLREDAKAKYETPLTPEEKQILEGMAQINAAARQFEDTVWWGERGLQWYVHRQRTHGGKALKPVNGVELMTFAMCARCMISLTDIETQQSVTLMCSEHTPTWDKRDDAIFGENSPHRDPHTMGLRGIEATFPMALQLIQSVIDAWAVNPKMFDIRQDGNVTLAIPGMLEGSKPWKRVRYRRRWRGRRQ